VQFNGTLNVGYDLSYTYGSEEGKKFQLESVKDVNYRTEEIPEGQQIENGHTYHYDKNGNLIYVNTNRVMTDGHRDNSVGERKLIWDEENRLLAVDDNGFVSNYWYDADGERTVKTSGESDQVYVNGVFSGGSTNTAKFSLYVSPYLVANQGGRYTKHIYAGSQRIVSKVGDFASYGSDPRRIEYAGANTDGLSVDYKSKYAAQQQVIRDNYKFFDVPYNGTDNDNYADGEGFCCNDGSMEAAVAEARKAQVRAVSRSFKDPDNYENLQFFYHPDHLGSSSFITNLDGEVVQHIEYVPFGEVFIEERNNVWNTPYLFNAKEFDEETGMYYYGARYYDARLSLWMSSDPKELKYPYISTYCYVGNNPIKYTDPDGQDWFVNDNDYFLWSENNEEPYFDYAGNCLPVGATPYRVLTRIQGQLYHANTNNVPAEFCNWLFGTNFVEHKLYDPAEEAFFDEFVSTAAWIGAFKVVGVGIKTVGGSSIWKLTPFQRGFAYEEYLKKMLKIKTNAIKSKNYPVIDVLSNGVGMSIKTLDVTAKSYLKGNTVYNTLKGYIDALAKFKPRHWGPSLVPEGSLKSKVLELGIPKGATPSQIQQIQKAIKYAESKNIKMNVRVIP